ncbi:hypothetical protein ASA_3665 [Aeromonas salmonicida subsp. salmonicida A449]|uniref:Uncharacterized protein n=1 Tax=Aeromonas salmonicida (strain A449) TaxID=382245 RepID=A4SRV4_AERS4|nr:hypothetical protein ASA_3665 [Aeromonas salmonicida subsp. salmonicida A449]
MAISIETPAPSTNSMTKGHPSGWPFVFSVPEQDAVSPKWRHVHDCALSDPGQCQRLSLLMTFDIVSMLASLHCFLSVSTFITGGSQVYPRCYLLFGRYRSVICPGLCSALFRCERVTLHSISAPLLPR